MMKLTSTEKWAICIGIIVIIIFISIPVALYFLTSSPDGCGSQTPAGIIADVKETASDTAVISFSTFNPDTKWSETKIILTTDINTNVYRISYENSSLIFTLSTDENIAGIELTGKDIDNDNIITKGDYITIHGLNKGSLYTVGVLYIPTGAIMDDKEFQLTHIFFKNDAQPSSDNTSVKGDSADNVCWFKNWGLYDRDTITCMKSAGSDLYIAGWACSGSEQNIYAHLSKCDMNGNEIWARSWWWGVRAQARSIALDRDYIYIAGDCYRNGTRYDMFLTKFDKNGNTIWNRFWDGGLDDSAYCIAINGSSVYIGGAGMPNGNLSRDAIFIKYDSSGEEIWNRTWGTLNLYESVGSIIADSTGAYITAMSYNFTNWTGKVSILKYDTDGNMVWKKDLAGVNTGGTMAMRDGKIYIAGAAQGKHKEEITCSHDLDLDVKLLEFDQSGNNDWDRQWGRADDDVINGIAIDSSGIYFAGATESGFNLSLYDALLIKLDSSGNIVWQKKWGYNDSEIASAIAILGNTVYIAGRTSSNQTSSHLFLFKTDSSGTGWTDITIESEQKDYTSFMIVTSVAIVCIVCVCVIYYISRKRNLIK